MNTAKELSNAIREIVANVSLRLTTQENYAVIPQESGSVMVITNTIQIEDMEDIAKALCEADYIVRYMGTNFFLVEENPCPTPEMIVSGKITRIPITFSDALKMLDDYSDCVAVVHEHAKDGHPEKGTIISTMNGSRDILSDIAMALSAGGLYVNYVSGCNFLEFQESPEYAKTKIVDLTGNVKDPAEKAVCSA